jgi:hypothetical protein
VFLVGATREFGQDFVALVLELLVNTYVREVITVDGRLLHNHEKSLLEG